MIDVTEHGEIALVTMRYGKANALDVAFCEALALRFEHLRHSSSRAVVLSGQGRIFCAGVDLPRLIEGGVDYVRAFLPALHRIYDTVFNFPKPVVAAINGHAIAGGCILACCADRRLMAHEGGRMGVTESLVGVPFPVMAFEVMRAATSVRLFPEAMLTGTTFAPPQAMERGWVHELVDHAGLTERALAVAGELAAIAPAAYAMTKRQIRAPAVERVAASAALDAEITAVWTAPQTIAHVAGFVARTLKK